MKKAVDYNVNHNPFNANTCLKTNIHKMKNDYSSFINNNRKASSNSNTIINETNNNSRHSKTNYSALDYQSLIEMCTKKLEEDPNHKKALLLRASSLVKKGSLDKAYRDALKLINLDDTNSASFYLLGCICEKMGNVILLT